MDIIELSKIGEAQYSNEDLAPVHSKSNDKKFKLEEVIDSFKNFFINDTIYLAGSIVSDGEGQDIDLIVRDEGLSDHLKEAIVFRLYRQFSSTYNIPYEDVPDHLHITFSSGPYTDYILLYRLKLERVLNPEIVRMNKLMIIEKSRRIIAGYASVIEVDLENQIITKEALTDALDKFMKEKNRLVTLEHQAIPVGEIIPEYGEYKTHVDDKGLFIVVEVRKDLEVANEVWDKIIKGELDGFSIHGEVLDSYVKNNVKIIKKMNLYEVAICKSPVNENSRFEVISK